MLGAIAGDVIGAPYEHHRIKRKDFPLFSHLSRFTDDTVLTVAVADVVLEGGDYGAALCRWGNRYPQAGYGGLFRAWLERPGTAPYGSFGNGSAMRVSPVAWAFDTADDVLREAQRSAAPTHDHPEGVKGAQATALGVFLARTGASKETVREEIAARFGYDLDATCDEIRPGYRFDPTCQGTVPAAFTAFLDAESFEDALRNAISLGGDSDTLAAIAGALAEPFFGGVPAALVADVRRRLAPPLLAVVDRFHRRFPPPQTSGSA
jgi:ADP-ribosylglycohydrolase